jgi:hypothetical protein
MCVKRAKTSQPTTSPCCTSAGRLVYSSISSASSSSSSCDMTGPFLAASTGRSKTKRGFSSCSSGHLRSVSSRLAEMTKVSVERPSALRVVHSASLCFHHRQSSSSCARSNAPVHLVRKVVYLPDETHLLRARYTRRVPNLSLALRRPPLPVHLDRIVHSQSLVGRARDEKGLLEVGQEGLEREDGLDEIWVRDANGRDGGAGEVVEVEGAEEDGLVSRSCPTSARS